MFSKVILISLLIYNVRSQVFRFGSQQPIQHSSISYSSSSFNSDPFDSTNHVISSFSTNQGSNHFGDTNNIRGIYTSNQDSHPLGGTNYVQYSSNQDLDRFDGTNYVVQRTYTSDQNLGLLGGTSYVERRYSSSQGWNDDFPVPSQSVEFRISNPSVNSERFPFPTNHDFADSNPFWRHEAAPSNSFQPQESTTRSTNGLGYLNQICGVAGNSISLIARGTAAKRSDHPWIVGLFKVYNSTTGVYRCGATLISRKHALSGAHCVESVRPNKLYLVLGRENIYDSTVGKSIYINNTVIHGDYRKVEDSADSDIAILTLAEEVVFSATIKPICLPSRLNFNELIGTTGLVVGWGTDENGAYSPKPKKTALPFVSETECLRSNPTFRTITSNRTYCAGLRNGTGPCGGDSGGGMFIKTDGKWRIRGIVSRGAATETNDESLVCDLSHFVIFVDVSKYINWILQEISDNL